MGATAGEACPCQCALDQRRHGNERSLRKFRRLKFIWDSLSKDVNGMVAVGTYEAAVSRGSWRHSRSRSPVIASSRATVQSFALSPRSQRTDRTLSRASSTQNDQNEIYPPRATFRGKKLSPFLIASGRWSRCTDASKDRDSSLGSSPGSMAGDAQGITSIGLDNEDDFGVSNFARLSNDIFGTCGSSRDARESNVYSPCSRQKCVHVR